MKLIVFSLALVILFASSCTSQDNRSGDRPFSKEDSQAAGKLLGIEFTEQETDSMYGNLLDALGDFESNREESIDNATAPALYFSPFPQGFEMPNGKDICNVSPKVCSLPDIRDDLAFYSIPQLAYLLQNRLISSTDLTQFFLERLVKYDPTLHCVITYTREYALERARQMDDELASGKIRGILHGIPYGLKDLFAVRGYRTTWGAMPFKDQEIDVDAAVFEMLEESGAVLVAKLTLGALAWGDVWYGEKTRNPWNPEAGSSGSSAGSASAVSAGLLPFAIGTETLGSIVSPSTVCGTTGLRPTFGRVSRHGAMALSWSMDKVGPICRSAEDCAIVFAEIEGEDSRDRSTTEGPFQYPSTKSNNTVRVGYVPRFYSDAYSYPFKRQDSIAFEQMKSMGFEMVPIALPDYPDITFLLQVEAAAAFDELTRSNADDLMVRQIRQAWPNTFRAARFVPAVEYIQANRLRTLLIEEMDDVFDKVDVILHPSWNSSMLAIGNMTGHPTVVIPNGFNNGTPTSMSMTGRLYNEGLLLEVAQRVQEELGYLGMRPDGFWESQ